MVAVDTNILVRRITNDDAELSPKAQQIITKAKHGSLLLDRLILEEVGYVLKSIYKFDKTFIGGILQSLVAEEAFFIPDRELVELTIKLFVVEKPLSFEDCWLLALKRNGKVKNVASFDAHLLKRL